MSNNTDAAVGLFTILMFSTIVGGWLTHIIHCLLTAKYVLLVAGAFIFPVGVIHGVGLWFGVNW